MVLEVVFVQYVVHESCGVFLPGGIGFGIRTVEGQIEREVRELLFDFVELVDVRSLFQSTCAVPERHGAFGLFGLEQVHDVAAHRSHPSAPADEDQLLRIGQVVRQEEFAVRTRDGHLVARLAAENVGRADTRIHFHEAAGRLVERRSGDTDVEHDDVAFGRMVGHRIGAESRFRIFGNQIPHFELVPVFAVLFIDIHI